MKFLEFLKSKEKLIVIFMCINSFALFVNVFDIRGVIYQNSDDYNNRFIRLLQSRADIEEKRDSFWPFVKYIHSGSVQYVGSTPRTGFGFCGIFNDFDYSEYLAYTILLFVVLYFVWDKKYKTT